MICYVVPHVLDYIGRTTINCFSAHAHNNGFATADVPETINIAWSVELGYYRYRWHIQCFRCLLKVQIKYKIQTVRALLINLKP